MHLVLQCAHSIGFFAATIRSCSLASFLIRRSRFQTSGEFFLTMTNYTLDTSCIGNRYGLIAFPIAMAASLSLNADDSRRLASVLLWVLSDTWADRSNTLSNQGTCCVWSVIIPSRTDKRRCKEQQVCAIFVASSGVHISPLPNSATFATLHLDPGHQLECVWGVASVNCYTEPPSYRVRCGIRVETPRGFHLMIIGIAVLQIDTQSARCAFLNSLWT